MARSHESSTEKVEENCPSCGMVMFNGRCLTLGCTHWTAPQFWDVETTDEEESLEEGNWLA